MRKNSIRQADLKPGAKEQFDAKVVAAARRQGECLISDIQPSSVRPRLRIGGLVMSAHQWSYLLNVGDLVAGMCVCHSCDVPRCIEPSHLWLGTHLDNMLDMHAKRRGGSTLRAQQIKAARTEDPKPQAAKPRVGKRGTRAFLVCEILLIRSRVLQGVGLRVVASDFGTSAGRISEIVRGNAYAYIPTLQSREDRELAVSSRTHAPRPIGAAGNPGTLAFWGTALNAGQVSEIKRLIAIGTPDKAIAREFGVKVTTIGAIRRGQTWRSVDPSPTPKAESGAAQ